MFADNALLVSLNISRATFRKLDKSATKEIAATHGVKASVGNYNKATLPGATELTTINTLVGDTRTYYYKQTLPWHTDGARILPNKSYLEFSQEMRSLKSKVEVAVDAFALAYPNLVAQSKLELGTLWNPADYPSDVRGLFKFDIKFAPIGQYNDFRIELAAEEQAKFEQSLASAEREATQEVWNRIYEVVSKASISLRDPDKTFRDSLVENAVELCALLPKLNINNDPAMEAMRVSIEGVLASKKPEALRALPSVRTSTVEGLDDILVKLSGYM